MPKLIFTLHNRIQFAIKKGLSGYVSPDKVSDEAYAEIMNIWRKYLPEYAKTRQINLYLKPFEKRELVATLAGTDSEGNKDVTLCHKYPIEAFVTANGKTVDILTIGEYRNRFNHPNKAPSASYPICKFENNKIYVAPRLDVTVIHLATPVKPVYAFTQSGDDYVYDDVNSVDIELDQVIHDDIVSRVLDNLGLNMRDSDLVNYSKQKQATENL